MYRILLVEDDPELCREIRKQLENYGHEVVPVRDFRNIPAEFAEAQPQLVLMDILLPFGDGYRWCAEIRRMSAVPIVFLSSASENMSIVLAMSMGGDDFIAKPVDPMVLCAKVNAVLRRAYEMKGESRLAEFHGAVLNLTGGQVSYESRTAELTKNEFGILLTLLENRGKIVSRDTLMLKLWQDDLYVEENTLTVNVGRLRKKLESIGMNDVILTRPGSGYLMP